MTIVNSLCVENTLDQTQNSADSNTTIFKAETAKQIAANLDLRFGNVPKVLKQQDKLSDITEKQTQSQPQTSSSTSSKNTQSTPQVEKLWVPLSQSTPMGDTLAVRGLLKRKSKLSNLAESAHSETSYNSSKEKGEEVSDGRDKDDESHVAYDQTPSKSKNVRQQDADSSTELQKLRDFKQYVEKLLNGSLLIDTYDKGDTNKTSIIIQLKDVADKKEESLKELENESRSVKSLNDSLKEECNSLKSVNSSLRETLALKDSELSSYKDKIASLEEEIETHLTNLEEKSSREKELLEKLQHVQGDTSKAISPSRFPPLGENKDQSQSIYSSLDLNSVDQLSQTEAHNLIKNILINLNIPFDETKEKVEQISQLLQTENVLSEFARKTHKLFYEKDWKINQIEQRTDLVKQCTTQMYQNIELLYAVLKKNT